MHSKGTSIRDGVTTVCVTIVVVVGVSVLASRYLVLMCKVTICHPST
jgi:hypothetical protein